MCILFSAYKTSRHKNSETAEDCFHNVWKGSIEKNLCKGNTCSCMKQDISWPVLCSYCSFKCFKCIVDGLQQWEASLPKDRKAVCVSWTSGSTIMSLFILEDRQCAHLVRWTRSRIWDRNPKLLLKIKWCQHQKWRPMCVGRHWWIIQFVWLSAHNSEYIFLGFIFL